LADHRPGSTPPGRRAPLTRHDVLDGTDVAELLDMPLSTVLEYARRGLLPARKLGRRWIFLRDEIEATVRGETPHRHA
jgi:excisionase family DNA binding protein